MKRRTEGLGVESQTQPSPGPLFCPVFDLIYKNLGMMVLSIKVVPTSSGSLRPENLC